MSGATDLVGDDAIPDNLRQALAEAEQLIAQVEDAFARARELDEKTAELAREYPEFAARAGIQVARIAYNNTGSLVSGAEYGLVAAGVVAVAAAASWLGSVWQKYKVEDRLRALAESKRALANERLGIVEHARPLLSRLARSFEENLSREAAVVIPEHRYPLKYAHLGGVERFSSMHLRTEWSLRVVEYLDAEMRAWLAGKPQSDATRPVEAAAYVAHVQVLFNSGIDWSAKVSLTDKLTAGRIHLLRSGAVENVRQIARQEKDTDTPLCYRSKEANEAVRSLVSAVGQKRVGCFFLPFGSERRRFMRLHESLLAESPSVQQAVSTSAATTVVALLALAVAGAYAEGWWAVRTSVSCEDRCQSLSRTWRTEPFEDMYAAELSSRGAECEAQRHRSSCEQLIKGIEEGAGRSVVAAQDQLTATSRQRELLDRLAHPDSPLSPEDLSLGPKELPCSDFPRLWELMATRAVKSPQAWNSVEFVSDEILAVAPKASADVLAVMKARSKVEAKKANKPKADLGKAFRICQIAEKMNVADPQCRKLR